MIEWVQHFWETTAWTSIFIGIGLFAVTFVLSYLVVCVILVKLPANYFHPDYEHHLLPNSHPVLRAVVIGGKNLLGVILILIGIALSLPGIPGPGFLTIFMGIMLMDFPGKRKLESKLISRPSILGSVNKLRAKYQKPPLLLE